jgi:Cu/Ag efflux pump CusA
VPRWLLDRSLLQKTGASQPFIRGTILPEASNPVSRFLIWVCRPIIAGVPRWRTLTLVLSVLALVLSLHPASRLGADFMPTLNEGALLHVPTSLPRMSITKTAELMQSMDGAMIPLEQSARVVVAKGAPSIRTENALLSTYIYVDIRDRDIGGYVADAKKAVAEQAKFPSGAYVTWSGQFEYMERAIYALIKQWRLRGGGEE